MTRLYFAVLIALALASCSANTSADNSLADKVKTAITAQQKSDTFLNLLVDTVKVKR